MFASLNISIIVFSLAALAIVTAGSKLARLADELADRTGMGEALFGILLLASVTSLPDLAATLSAALDARPDLAMSNVMGSMVKAWVGFITLAAVTGVSGWVLMEAAKGIADQTGLSDTLVGGLLTALATSTPELVTTIAAIRYGALTLAVSNIFGTNCFNMLVVAAADLAYPHSSIYHDMAPVQMTWGLVSILMTAILLLGMVRRETYGFGRIGFESTLLLTVYALAIGIVVVGG